MNGTVNRLEMEVKTPMKISILLADNQSTVRKSLSARLRKEKDIIVSAETDNAYSLFELLTQHAPDILIFDMDMDGNRGIEILKEITNKYDERVRVITFTENIDIVALCDFFKNGGKGYLHKTCSFQELLRAIHNVYKGKFYICPDFGGKIIHDIFSTFLPLELALREKLSVRENEVFLLIKEGKTTKEIASLLSISINTVKIHKRHIMEKLEVHSMIELIKKSLFI
jgi:two-component system, NarL family, response regulator NreC